MPWIDNVSAVLEAWYPGIRGAEAIANILFGDVNPSAKLPVTFAKSDAGPAASRDPGIDLVPQAPPAGSAGGRGAGGGRGMLPPFDIPYTEGLKVGYKWFDAENKEPLFPFGHGLSYTTFSYSGLKAAMAGRDLRVSFTVKNTGNRAGAEIAQVYAALPPAAGEPPKRLVGMGKGATGCRRKPHRHGEYRAAVPVCIQCGQGRLAARTRGIPAYGGRIVAELAARGKGEDLGRLNWGPGAGGQGPGP